ncbi:hypothetical protein BH23ACT5_BH23ACT5_09840 [soil metagenome]
MATIRDRSLAVRDEIAARHAELRDYYLRSGWTSCADRDARLVDYLESGLPVRVPSWEAGGGASDHYPVTVEADGSVRTGRGS